MHVFVTNKTVPFSPWLSARQQMEFWPAQLLEEQACLMRREPGHKQDDDGVNGRFEPVNLGALVRPA